MSYDCFKNIIILAKHGNEYLDRILEPYNLNSSYRIFIKKIVENPGITRDNLKQIVYVHPSNTTRALQYLEEVKLIDVKLKATDKRILEIYPTLKLQEIYDVILKAEDEWIDIVTADFSKEDKELFIKLIKEAKSASIKEIHKEDM